MPAPYGEGENPTPCPSPFSKNENGEGSKQKTKKRKDIMYDDYQTQIPAGLIDEAELSDLVGRLAKHLGAEASIEKVYIVRVDDVEVSGMIETLADRLISNGKSKTVEGAARKGKKKGKRNVPTEKQKLGKHSYVFDESGETISAQALNKRIAAHEVARGTRLENGRGEKFEIVQGPEEGRFVMARVAEGEQA